MKQRISIMITLCLALTACGNKAETPNTAEITPLKQMIIDEYNARGVKPGMSIDEVKAAEQLTIEEDVASAIITADYSLRHFKSTETFDYDGLPYTIEYAFSNDKLSYFSYEAELEYDYSEYPNAGGFYTYNLKKIAYSDTYGLPSRVDDDSPYPSGLKPEFFYSVWSDGNEEKPTTWVSLHAYQDPLPSVYDDDIMSDSLTITFSWDGN